MIMEFSSFDVKAPKVSSASLMRCTEGMTAGHNSVFSKQVATSCLEGFAKRDEKHLIRILLGQHRFQRKKERDSTQSSIGTDR